MKENKTLWILTIVNTTVLVLILLFAVIGLFTPQSNYENELREWVVEQNEDNVRWLNEYGEKLKKHVDDSNKATVEYVNTEVEKVYKNQ